MMTAGSINTNDTNYRAGVVNLEKRPFASKRIKDTSILFVSRYERTSTCNTGVQATSENVVIIIIIILIILNI